MVQCGRGGLALEPVLAEERVDIGVVNGLREVRVEAVLERGDGVGGGEDGGYGGCLGGVFPLFKRGWKVRERAGRIFGVLKVPELEECFNTGDIDRCRGGAGLGDCVVRVAGSTLLGGWGHGRGGAGDLGWRRKSGSLWDGGGRGRGCLRCGESPCTATAGLTNGSFYAG